MLAADHEVDLCVGVGEELAGCREVEEVSVIEGAEAREEVQGEEASVLLEAEVEVVIPISQGHSVGVDLRNIGEHGVLAICSLSMR